MKIKLSNLVRLLDKNYEGIARKLTREQVLALDRLTTDIEYENRGEEYYYPEARIADEFDAVGISRNAISTMVRRSRTEMETRHLPDVIEEQIEILEQLLIPTGRVNPITFSDSMRNQIRRKLSKMTIKRMEASLRPVKLREKSIKEWVNEEDPIAARDAEFEKFMKGETRNGTILRNRRENDKLHR